MPPPLACRVSSAVPRHPTIDKWLQADFDVFVRPCGVTEGERAVVLVDYLGGCAKQEVLCHPDEVRRDFGALVSLLQRVFGPCETVASPYAEFYPLVTVVSMVPNKRQNTSLVDAVPSTAHLRGSMVSLSWTL